MRVGLVILPEYRWWAAEPKWRAVERLGFDHGWTYDHLGWRSLVDGPWFSAIPTLTAAATVTERIGLGTIVASPHFRHPVSFAREVTTLDDVADGRLLLGIGAGAITGFDTEVLGTEPLSRRQLVDRFAEFLELLDAVLVNDRTTWTGEFYSAVDARSAPGCVRMPRVPFVIAANGRRTIGLVAKFGQGWVTTGQRTEDYEQWWRGVAERVGWLDDALIDAQRPPHTVRRYLSLDAAPVYSLSSVACFTDMVGRATRLGFTDVLAHWPRADGVYAGHESVVEQVAADVLPTLPGHTRTG
ncbi:MAG TPA: LLM class flavin-dependent oxidoreductase [Pseudonocardiaceae bacterium]|jgi:alkanesulfonate monooxygenase SsuD/methylene tetrahydromethanopterin reductase-like flavin-dependent oxidoreductase (luciferase family)|nr:LLM class flavin-dependent oxidoreductase [Pseudonocardiaceae bacterium]